jgi:LysR family hca operon transcriptional activator
MENINIGRIRRNAMNETVFMFRSRRTAPLIVLMPSDHRLTAREAVRPQDFVGETFIGGSNKASVLRAVTEDYLLPSSVVSRPLEGEAPTIDLAVGYSKANTSPILKLFLSRLDELVAPSAATAASSTSSNPD